MPKDHPSPDPELFQLSLQQPTVTRKALPAWPWSPSKSDVGLPLLLVPEDTKTTQPAFSAPQVAEGVSDGRTCHLPLPTDLQENLQSMTN